MALHGGDSGTGVRDGVDVSDSRAKAFQDAHIALDLLEQSEGWPNMTRAGLVFDSHRKPGAEQVLAILGVHTIDPTVRRCSDCGAVSVAQFADVDRKVLVFACGAVAHRTAWVVGDDGAEVAKYEHLINCRWVESLP